VTAETISVEDARARVLFDPNWLFVHGHDIDHSWADEETAKVNIDYLNLHVTQNSTDLNSTYQAQWLLQKVLDITVNYPMTYRPLLESALEEVQQQGRTRQQAGASLRVLTEESLWRLWLANRQGIRTFVTRHVTMCLRAGMYESEEERKGLRWYLHVASGDWRGIWQT
jgi:hypothetical protein